MTATILCFSFGGGSFRLSSDFQVTGTTGESTTLGPGATHAALAEPSPAEPISSCAHAPHCIPAVSQCPSTVPQAAGKQPKCTAKEN